MKEFMAGLTPDYQTLLNRHGEIHGEMFNRMKLDLGGGKDQKIKLVLSSDIANISASEGTTKIAEMGGIKIHASIDMMIRNNYISYCDRGL
jgi:hypothetical protein